MIERPAPGAGRDADIRTYPVKSGESVAAGDVVDVVGGAVTAGRVAVGSLAVGSIIKLNENGVPTDFYVAKHDYENGLNGAGRTLLVRKDCYDNRNWHGANVNAYATSAIDGWLNSTYKALFPADIQAAIGITKFFYTPGNGSNGVTILQRAVFLLSMTELGQSYSGASVEGSVLPIAGTLKIAHMNGSACFQQTRSPYTGNTSSAWIILSDGSAGPKFCSEAFGSRPAFTLPSSFVIDSNEPSSQAIALQSGAAGQSIDVIFDGTAELPGITAGTSVTSPGVQGYSPQDGWLWVKPEWEQQLSSAKYISGSYTGDGSTSKREINLGERPAFVYIEGAVIATGYQGIAILADAGSTDGFSFDTYPRTAQIYNGGVTDSGFRLGVQVIANISGQVYKYTALILRKE